MLLRRHPRGVALGALGRKGFHLDCSRHELRGTTDRAELVAIVAFAMPPAFAFVVAIVAFLVA
eukprot:scaffold56684_cov43-Phaeocystis_antarctica.AAC.2